MKTKLLVFLIAIFSIVFTTSVFGAETKISLKSAVLNKDNFVTISGSIDNPVENQQITFMATSLVNDNYSVDDIFYLNQSTAILDSNNDFKLSFNVNPLIEKDNVYIIRVGGTNINTPAQMIILSENEQGNVMLGDVNLDGIITADDAALTLQEVLFHIETLSQRQIDAMKVTKSELITSNDAANILTKALNSMYIFPINQ